MLEKILLAIDLTLITILLYFACVNYWSGSLFFIGDVFVILFLSANRIARWQVKRLIRKSEQEFEAMYLNELERRGQDNGSRLK